MKKTRLGVIGVCGRGGLADYAHMPDKKISIVAGADISHEALQNFQKRLGSKIPIYNDYREMLEKEDLDAVFVTSPDFCHEEQAVAALEKKVAVYLEKPMAITIDGCDRILRAAYDNKTKIFLGHNMRYMSFIHKMKELIDAGIIGEVKAIWCRHFISYGGDAYFRDWHSEQQYATSLLLQKGAHDIDIIHWLAGSYTKRVTGLGTISVYNKCRRRKPEEKGNPSFNATHWPPLEQSGFSSVIDVEDQNMILMQLGNGVQASYMQCHFTPDACRNYTIIGTKGRIENYGDYGADCTVEVWTERHDFFRLHGDQSIKFEAATENHGGADSKIVKGFLRYLTDGEKPFSTPQASRYSVAVGYMGAKSIRTNGLPMDIPPLDKNLEEYIF